MCEDCWLLDLRALVAFKRGIWGQRSYSIQLQGYLDLQVQDTVSSKHQIPVLHKVFKQISATKHCRVFHISQVNLA